MPDDILTTLTSKGEDMAKYNNSHISKEDYVKVPKNHIVIDFDISDGNGNKLRGKGIHLHYIYKGDVDKLSGIYDDKIKEEQNNAG